MAPEAWRDDKNTIALDAYALGMVFYELATLRHPFNLTTDDPQKWMEAHLYTPVPAPNKINAAIGPKLSQIIMGMIDKNVSRRLIDWSKILELLQDSEPRSAENKQLIEVMLTKRLEHDSANQAAAAEKERKRNSVMSFAGSFCSSFSKL
jgi:serine/threonine protein kinase